MNENGISTKADKIISRQKHIKKCIAADICPTCGTTLVDCGGENLIEVGCIPCGEDYVVKKYWLFGPEITKRRPKVWGMLN